MHYKMSVMNQQSISPRRQINRVTLFAAAATTESFLLRLQSAFLYTCFLIGRTLRLNEVLLTVIFLRLRKQSIAVNFIAVIIYEVISGSVQFSTHEFKITRHLSRLQYEFSTGLDIIFMFAKSMHGFMGVPLGLRTLSHLSLVF